MAKAKRAIIFDAGGVLLHPNFAWICGELRKLDVELSIDTLHKNYYKMVCSADNDPTLDRRGVAFTSEGSRTWIFHRLLSPSLSERKLDRVTQPLARQSLNRFPNEGDIFFWSMPSVKESLASLKKSGFALGVASNNDGSLEAQLTQVEIIHFFDIRLDSAIEKTSKPDPELLIRAAKKLNQKIEDCAYIGDIDRVDGAAARDAGMDFLLIDPLKQERKMKPEMIASLDEIKNFFFYEKGMPL